MDCRKLLSERSIQGAAFREDRIGEAEFWNCVVELAGGDSANRPSDSMLSRLWSETYKLNFEVLDILMEIRRRSPVGVLTNIDRARSGYLIDVVQIARYVDIYIPSYELKATKLSKEMWKCADELVKQRFGPREVVYVDDRQEHVEVSKSVGWRGLLFRDAGNFRKELSALGLLPEAEASIE